MVGMAGLVIGVLTVGFNTHLGTSDRLLLLAWFIAGYALVGLVLGVVALALLALARTVRLPEKIVAVLARTATTLAIVGPLAYLALLPDLGLLPPILTDVIFSWSRSVLAGVAVGVLVLTGLAGELVGFLLRRWPGLGRGLATASVLTWVLGAIALVVVGVTRFQAPEAVGAEEEVEVAATISETPVVVLCIDGADLDDVILPMVKNGELPAFARMMEEGTWGPLATIEPTLSPIVWTTLATGRTPEDHGIFHFVNFRVPGLRQAVLRFPLHTGLNFRIFPLLEKIPGIAPLRRPYTSNMRRVPALWNMAGRFAAVGAYRWLITWPAETFEGFNYAASAVVTNSENDLFLSENERPAGSLHPADALEGLQWTRRRQVEIAELEPYAGDGVRIDRRRKKVRFVDRRIRDPSLAILKHLIDRYEPRLTMASFYSVDGFQHIFSVDRLRGGPFSGAIEERYRFTDVHLGELMDFLGDDANLIVVSDHGFDFEHHHHTWAPAGIFFGWGPAFEADRNVESLSVYDIAPLVLRLLNLPLPEDMPGTLTGTYQDSLSRAFLGAQPELRIATYGAWAAASQTPQESSQDEEIKELLRDLGYIQ